MTFISYLNSNLGTLTTNGTVTKFEPKSDGLYATYKVGADTVTKKLGSSTFNYINLYGLTWDIGAAGRTAAQFNFKLNDTKVLKFNVEGWFQSSFHTANYYYSTTLIIMNCSENTEYYIKTTSGSVQLVSIT